MRKEVLANDHFYHIYNRGVDKRTIFQNKRDFERFLIALYLSNENGRPQNHINRLNLHEISDLASINHERPLVDIIQWSLMPNHFHLLLHQRMDNGISDFMQKVGTSYTMYFNINRERNGRLFQGAFKAKRVDTDAYFTRLATYIALNPLELNMPDWEDVGILQHQIPQAENFLAQYGWTSFNDYFNNSLIPNFVNIPLFFKIFGGTLENYKTHVHKILTNPISQSDKTRLHTFEQERRRAVVKAWP